MNDQLRFYFPRGDLTMSSLIHLISVAGSTVVVLVGAASDGIQSNVLIGIITDRDYADLSCHGTGC